MTSIRTLAIGTGFAATLFAAPGLALAAGEFHPAGGELGWTQHSQHRVATRERADVVAERNAALRPQARAAMPSGEAMETTMRQAAGMGLTRAQVEREARRAMQADEIPEGNG
ncbi:hypothetical protein GT347_06485 [Xylophilus rhododendri]|uniref:DUF4148 domain-containing protein n=1 Tax=Xylophilus rhododendri TaxID=2697032 RepID=A0A857J224_9BURK|nr:hypothetical protein [Xylophilus rhododendri]QHI97667.1 hypothetical protein GT347_06485 [Xylophilus rhododendri]